MQPDLLLPLLCLGMKSGLVVDIGNKECRVIAIAHGRALMHSYRSRFYKFCKINDF